MNMTNNINSLATYIFYGDFGLLTIVPYFLFKILFPIITSFYLLQLFLLESNLFEIVSFKTDRILNKFGLSSNTLLPLLLGFGCVTVALGTLQLTSNTQERRIAQILLCMVIPCSAQLVINTALVFQTSKHYLVAYILIVSLAFLLFSFILNIIFSNRNSGRRSHCNKYKCKYYFKVPKFFPLIYKALCNSFTFLIETAVPFAIGNIIVSILYYFGYIHKLCTLASPIFSDFLRLPTESATIFILSIVKKDLGAASLLALFANGNFSEPQIFICTIMLTFFVPCLASMIILFKHESKLITFIIWILCVFMSLFIGKILSLLLILP